MYVWMVAALMPPPKFVETDLCVAARSPAGTILFSHPDDFTPVCTTELGEVAKLLPEFKKRNVKGASALLPRLQSIQSLILSLIIVLRPVIGLSANDISSHEAWTKDIEEISKAEVAFPIIADKDRKVRVARGGVQWRAISDAYKSVILKSAGRHGVRHARRARQDQRRR